MGGGTMIHSARILIEVDGKGYDDSVIRAAEVSKLREAMRVHLEDFGTLTKLGDGEFTVPVAEARFHRKAKRIGQTFTIKIWEFRRASARVRSYFAFSMPALAT